VLGRVLVILLAAGLSGCVYGGGDDVRIHYIEFGATPPQGNTVTVCHAYTCRMQTPYTFSQKDLAEIRAVMAKNKHADTPYEERRAVAYAIAYIDVKVGNKLGIHDRAGMQFGSSGDPTQEDCVDVSTNTTSYLLVMQANGMLKHHTVGGTMSKANLGKGLMQLESGEILAALVGDPEGEGERPEICGRSLAVRPGREPRRSEGRELVHQGPRVGGRLAAGVYPAKSAPSLANSALFPGLRLAPE